MSTRLRDAVWKLNFRPAGLKLVALRMADLANDEGRCIVSVQKIAEACGLSVEQTRIYIAGLKKVGLLIVTPMKREDGGQMENAYQWNLSWVKPIKGDVLCA